MSIENKNLPNSKKPCRECPFRKDSNKGWLGGERMAQILNADSFVCHKNTDLQCAGHMLIRGAGNAFVRLANRLGLDAGLTGRELVFNSNKECVAHHEGEL